MKKTSAKRTGTRKSGTSVRVGSGAKKSSSRSATGVNKRLLLTGFVVVFGCLGILTILASHADPIGRVQRFLPWGSGVQFPMQLSDYVIDPSGNMWFSSGPNKKIGEYPAGSTSTSQPIWYSLPAGYGAASITSDRSGNIWFAAQGSVIGEITAGSHSMVFYPLGSNHVMAGLSTGTLTGSLLADQAGNLWFLMYGSPTVDQITVNMIGELPAGTPPSRAASAVRTTNASAIHTYMGLTTDPQDNVWVNEWKGEQGTPNDNGLAKIPAGSTLPYVRDLPLQYHFVTNSLPSVSAFASDRQGNIWMAVTQEGTSNRVNYIAELPAGSSTSATPKLYSLPTAYGARTITFDSAGNLWAAGGTYNQTGETWIATVQLSGSNAKLTKYGLPDIGRHWQFFNLSSDTAGNIWFSQPGPNEVDEIVSTTAGKTVSGAPISASTGSGSQSSAAAGSGTSSSGASSSNANGSSASNGTSSGNGSSMSNSSASTKPTKSTAVYAKKHHWYDPLLFWHYF